MVRTVLREVYSSMNYKVQVEKTHTPSRECTAKGKHPVVESRMGTAVN